MHVPDVTWSGTKPNWLQGWYCISTSSTSESLIQGQVEILANKPALLPCASLAISFVNVLLEEMGLEWVLLEDIEFLFSCSTWYTLCISQVRCASQDINLNERRQINVKYLYTLTCITWFTGTRFFFRTPEKFRKHFACGSWFITIFLFLFSNLCRVMYSLKNEQECFIRF